MKTVKIFSFLILISLLVVSCSESEITSTADVDTTGDVMAKPTADLVGEHYNLNIIGVKDKSMNDIAVGHVIFVDLYETSVINLQKGDDYAVLDKNGTDDDGALLQLPDPGFEPYVTELPFGFDTTTDYSVYARPLGKPMTGAIITTMADLSLIGDAIVGKKDSRLWDNIMDEYGAYDLTITWGEFVPNPVEFERLKGKSTFQNVTAELLSVVYEVHVTYDEDGDPGTTDDIVELMFHVRIPIFNEILKGEYWKYDNNGLKLLQVRFYPFGTDVTYDDIENGWDSL